MKINTDLNNSATDNSENETSLLDLISNAFRTQSNITSTSYSNLLQFALKNNSSKQPEERNSIEPFELSTLLDTTKSYSPLLIDMRPLDLYEKSHIRHSIHMNVPTLLLKRYSRGVIPPNLNLESFISTPEGIDIYKSWLKQFQVDDIQHLPNYAQCVLYDEQMIDLSPVWVFLNAIQKNTKAAVTWLNSGYRGFYQWDFTHNYIISKLNLPTPSRSATTTTAHNNKKVDVQRRASLFNLDTSSKNRTNVAQRLLVVETETVPVTPKTENEYDFVVSEIIPHFLYLGPEIVTTDQLIGLQSRSIKRILNMAEECDDNVPGLKEQFNYTKIAARDTVDMKNIQGTFRKAVHVIDDAKKSHEPIYVHCQAGKSRSAAVVLAYLVLSEKWTLKKAYQLIVKARPNISPNIGFVAELMEMEQAVHGKVSNFVGTDWSRHPSSPDTQNEVRRIEKAWKRS